MPFYTDDAEHPATLSSVVGEGVGAASVCWEDMSGTGIFQDQKARAIVEDIVAFVEANYVPKVKAAPTDPGNIGEHSIDFGGGNKVQQR